MNVPNVNGSKSSRRPIRVLEVISNAIVGGVENYVRNLIRLLPPDAFQISLLCPYESGVISDLRRAGYPVFLTPMKGMPPEIPWGAIQTAVGVIRGQQIDIIHAHMPKGQMIGGIAGALSHTPIAATFHGRSMTAEELSIHQLTGSHLIAVCQEAYTQAMAMGVSPANITLIHNGVDLERFRPGLDGSNFRESAGIPLEAPLVGFVGRLSWEKGPDQFVEAAAVVHRQRPDVHFAVVGEGPVDTYLAELIHQHELEEVVHLAGLWADPAEVYPALDLIALTSHSEGMPLALLEAMACGVPVAAMNVGGVLEIVEFGKTGLLVSPGDPDEMGRTLVSLLSRPEGLKQMGLAGRQRAEALFDLRTSVRQTADLFRELARSEQKERKAANGVAARPDLSQTGVPLRNGMSHGKAPNN